MTTLLTYAGPVPADSTGSRLGGVQLTPNGFRWPECTTCSGPLQFVAQLQLDQTRTVAVFVCDNTRGLPELGAQGRRQQRAGLRVRRPRSGDGPGRGRHRPRRVAGLELAGPVEGHYLDASSAWKEATGRSESVALGQWGGEPWWIQDEEIPDRTGCDAPMSFVARLNEGHHQSGANVGNGDGYAFVCDPCERGGSLPVLTFCAPTGRA